MSAVEPMNTTVLNRHRLGNALQSVLLLGGMLPVLALIGLLERILLPGRRVPDPSLLRTHPHTQARIERLLSLAPEPVHPPIRLDLADPWREPGLPAVMRAPRQQPWSRLWY